MNDDALCTKIHMDYATVRQWHRKIGAGNTTRKSPRRETAIVRRWVHQSSSAPQDPPLCAYVQRAAKIESDWSRQIFIVTPRWKALCEQI